MSTRLCLLLWLIWLLCFRFDELTEFGAFMRTEFLCISVLRVASWPRVKLASCKNDLNTPVVYSTDRSKAVVPVLVLLFVALWFVLRCDLFYILPCVILLLCFLILLALRLPRLRNRAYLCAFRTFVRFVLDWICRFSLPLGVWKELRFVVVALFGLFIPFISYVVFAFYYCFLISLSFGASGSLCFVSVAFLGYINITKTRLFKYIENFQKLNIFR